MLCRATVTRAPVNLLHWQRRCRKDNSFVRLRATQGTEAAAPVDPPALDRSGTFARGRAASEAGRSAETSAVRRAALGTSARRWYPDEVVPRFRARRHPRDA